MSKFKRILAALLAALTILPCVACANDDPTEDDTNSGTTASSEDETSFFPDIERQDYGGDTFCVYVYGGGRDWYIATEYQTNAGGNTVNVLNNTIYEMNTRVEEYLNVELISDSEIGTPVETSVMSGDDLYQALMLHAYWYVAPYVSRGFVMDMYELEDIDFSQFYWNGDMIEELSINDMALVAVGDLCWDAIHMIYTNKDLMETANMSMPYDKVRNGQWTFSELAAMTVDMYIDDGDGLRNNKDTYGFLAGWADWGAVLPQAGDIFLASKNENGGFDLTIYNERSVDYYDQIYNWSRGDGVWRICYGDSDDKQIDFKNNQAYMYGGTLGTGFLDVDFKLGMLPMPKYDVEQENYSHVNWGSELLVPTTVRNRAMVGQVLELMSFYSGTLVREKYYDEILQLRVSEAPDDRDMVEIIYNTIVYDPGMVYAHAGNNTGSLYPLAYTFYNCINNGDSSFASYYKQHGKAAQKQLDNLVTKVTQTYK